MGRVDPDVVLGQLLRGARVVAGLTVEGAAAASGLSPTRLAGVEEGSGLLFAADLVPLLRAYRTSLSLFGVQYERAIAALEEAVS
jgi:transcriptional regulator with XRE-family HTH domain